MSAGTQVAPAEQRPQLPEDEEAEARGDLPIVVSSFLGVPAAAPAAGAGPALGHTLCAAVFILVASGYVDRRSCT